MYLFMLFTLFRFFLFMFNKYHFNFVYYCCFILCMCIDIYVYIFIYDSFIYFVLLLFIVHFWLSIVWLLKLICVFYYFDCLMYILYEYLCMHKYVFCFALTCVYVYSILSGLTSLRVNMSTCSGFWNRYGWNRSGSRICLRTHIWEGEVHTGVNIFSINMVCVYS